MAGRRRTGCRSRPDESPGRGRGTRRGRHPGVGGLRDRGSVTAELALAFPVVVLGLLLTVAVGQVVIAQVRCTDAARVGAREAARGEANGVVIRQAQQVGPPGAQVAVAGGGPLVAVDVTAVVQLPLPGAPGVTVRGHAVGPKEGP